jgi:ATP-dependent DNA helicase RecG
LVDQTVDFVLSKLYYSVGTRAEKIEFPGKYEISKEIVLEAIVNAIAKEIIQIME